MLPLFLARVGKVHSVEENRYYSSVVFGVQDASPLPGRSASECTEMVGKMSLYKIGLVTQAHLKYFKLNRCFRKKMSSP